MNFDNAVTLILDHEGGYVNSPKDPGGETKYGISKRAYPNEDIKNLTKDRAKEIYRRDYWNKIRGDYLPFPVAVVVFDMAVNAGVGRAIKMLQKAANVKADGVIGPATEHAISCLSAAYLCENITTQRIQYYASLPTFGTFGNGWIRRSVETLVFALTTLRVS